MAADKIIPTDDPRYLSLFSDDALVGQLVQRHGRVVVICDGPEKFTYEIWPGDRFVATGMMRRAIGMIESEWK